jgi:hypothetical protein
MATIKSHKDAAYQAAKANDALQDAAKFVFDHCPTVLDGMPDDVKADLNDGWMLRYSEKHPEQIYVRVDGNLILPSGKVPEKAEKVQVSVFSAMSYSQQMFGQLKNIDPGLHGVIKTWRDAWIKYRGNREKDLLRAIRELQSGGVKTRKPTDDFVVFIAKHMDTARDRCKTAASRGDVTADLGLLDKQIAAFWSIK